MANTVEELRNEFPELVAKIEADAREQVNAENAEAVNAAVSAERQRLEEIDKYGDLFSAELVAEAKYGENPCSAKDLAMRAAEAAKKNGQSFLKGLEEDTKESGTNGVGSAPADDEHLSEAQKKEKTVSAVKKLFHKEEE